MTGQRLASPAPRRNEKLTKPCLAGSVTCVYVTVASNGPHPQLPLVFGIPFIDGAISKEDGVEARSANGQVLPLQLDGVASNDDGSLRFATIALALPPDLMASDNPISLLKTPKRLAPATVTVPPPTSPDWGVTLRFSIYDAQISEVTFGNRSAYTPGIPFIVGEQITLRLGSDPADQYTLRIDKATEGGGFESLTRLAAAFMAVINKGSHFRAYKIGQGGGYERLWITAARPPGQPFEVHWDFAGRAQIHARTVQSWSAPEEFLASSREALAAARREGKLRTWLVGPLVTEYVVSTPIRSVRDNHPHPLLQARFYIRAFVGSDDVRTDVVVENDWSYRPGPRNVHYDVAIIQGHKQVFENKGIEHFHHARWHLVLWSNERPSTGVSFDTRYLSRTGSIPNYDPEINASGAAIEEIRRQLRTAAFGPMRNGTITLAMPTVGGRDDIGPLPKWAAIYLTTMDAAARDLTLANGDAAGSAPIHYRDEKTDLPASLDDHPGMAMEFGDPRPGDAFPKLGYDETPWTPDGAHQPSLAYIPYLITGDLYYLEELLFWANWDMGRFNPEYRGGARGLVYSSEIRDQAWTLRTIAHAAYVMPDGHPMKRYFNAKLANNLLWYTQHYVHNPDPNLSPLHWLENVYGYGMTSPWMHDFVVIEMGQIAELGFKDADPVMRWFAGFSVGRWINEANGYCEKMGPAYYIHVRYPTNVAVKTWKELFDLNWPNVKSCPNDFLEGSYPQVPFGYVAVARATLGMLAGFAVPGAHEAYERLRQQTPALTSAYSHDPTWAIVPGAPGRR